MASQQRELRARGRFVVNEDQILDELDRSEGDFSASDDDDLYEPPDLRPNSISDGYNSSDSEESIHLLDDDRVLSTPTLSSPTLSSSSLIRGHRESRVRRGQSSRRGARGRGRLTRVRGRDRIVQGNNQTSNTWTGVFSPTIHNLLSPNYVQRDFSNFEMFQYFEDYIEDKILEKIVTATNQTEMMKTQKNLGLTLRELKTFFGITMVMATVGYPKIKMYWEKAWRLPIVADNMTRDRFFLLRTRLKVVFDNDVPESQRVIDKIWKVRPLFDRICEGCHVQQKSEHLSIDEMIIPFSGQCGIRQYCPNKPNPVGLKVFVLANPNGCICDMKVYEGATTFPGYDGFSLGDSAVLHLTTSLVPGHYLYFDRYFTSVKLMQELTHRGFNATGTIMKNRVPRDCVMTPDSEFSKQSRGTTEVRASQDGKIGVVKWLDNKAVLLMSTCLTDEKVDTCKRWNKITKRYVQVPRPEVIKMYNANMGGVDLADRMIAVCPIRARTRKWTIRFIFHMIDIAVSNSWITYREQRKLQNDSLHKIPQLREYKLKLGFKLIEENSVSLAEEESCDEHLDLPSQQKNRRIIINPLPTLQKRTSNARHMPQFTKKQQRCRMEGCNKKTTAKCRFCRVYLLCLCSSCSSRNCFAQFHGCTADSDSE